MWQQRRDFLSDDEYFMLLGLTDILNGQAALPSRKSDLDRHLEAIRLLALGAEDPALVDDLISLAHRLERVGRGRAHSITMSRIRQDYFDLLVYCRFRLNMDLAMMADMLVPDALDWQKKGVARMISKALERAETQKALEPYFGPFLNRQS